MIIINFYFNSILWTRSVHFLRYLQIPLFLIFNSNGKASRPNKEFSIQILNYFRVGLDRVGVWDFSPRFSARAGDCNFYRIFHGTAITWGQCAGWVWWSWVLKSFVNLNQESWKIVYRFQICDLFISLTPTLSGFEILNDRTLINQNWLNFLKTSFVIKILLKNINNNFRIFSRKIIMNWSLQNKNNNLHKNV